MRKSVVSALAGVLAALVGVAAGHLVAALTDPAASPVLVVGSTVIDLTPTPLKDWAIVHFGTHDKAVLVGSVLVGVLVLAAVAGLLAGRRPTSGVALLLVLVAVPAVASLTRPTASAVDLVPSLVTAVAGVGSLLWLVRAAHRQPHRQPRRPATSGAGVVVPEVAGPGVVDPESADTGVRRRGVLVAGGVLAVAAVAMGSAGRRIAAYRSRGTTLDLPRAADPAGPFPRGLEDRVPGITPLRTATGSFYRVDTRLTLPLIDAGGWTLTIDGDVDREVSFGIDDLLGMRLVERDIALTCVSNDVGGTYVGAARWLGVPLQDLLDRAGTGHSRADQILSTDVDGMTISTPLAVALDGRDAMIAVGMNGASLPREHGFPARMVVPGLYGFVSACKWITRMTLTTYAEQTAYWTDRDWATEAPIKISSRIDTPKPLSTVRAGRTVIGGIAWAQHRGGVDRVEVRVDGGPWQPARLGPDAGVDYWRQWYLPWSAEPGQHTLAVRATDGRGEVQTAARATPFPNGSSGIQQIVVDVR